MGIERFIGIAAQLLEIVIQIIGPENTKALLDKSAVDRANALADMAEDIKFRLAQDFQET